MKVGHLFLFTYSLNPVSRVGAYSIAPLFEGALDSGNTVFKEIFDKKVSYWHI